MAMTTCPECSSEISDLAQACPQCGAPVVSDARKEYNRLLAIDILAKRKYRVQGIGLTVVVFLLTVLGLENLFEDYPGNATWLIFAVAVFAAYMARMALYVVMAKRIRREMTPQELREAWLSLGGFD